MNWPLLVFFIGFIAIFVLRLPIAAGMLATSIFYLVVAPGAGADVSMFAEKVLTNLEAKYIIIAVPLFVFMAQVMNSGKITDMIFRFANVLVGRRKGGLGHVNVAASIIFSGMTGSAVADASGLGMMEIRAMKEHGYEEDFSCAVTAASATIGPVFPPSIPMIFYAMLSGASIGNLFLGGIYSGVVTPTEAGALASFYAIIIAALVYRALRSEVFVESRKRYGENYGNPFAYRRLFLYFFLSSLPVSIFPNWLRISC